MTERATRLDKYEFPLWLGYADHYYRGTHDLHICCVVGDSTDFCVVVHSGVGVLGGGVPSFVYSSVCIPPGHNGPLQGGDHKRELRVSIRIGEPVEDAEEIDDSIVVPNLTRLHQLEMLDSPSFHLPGAGPPPFSVLRSLLVLPFDGVFPDALPEDREHDVAAMRPRDQGGGKMVKPGSQVVDDIGGDDPDISVLGEARELQAVDLSAALDRGGDLIRVAVRIPVDLHFEVCEVLFGPSDLLEVGRDQLGHGGAS